MTDADDRADRSILLVDDDDAFRSVMARALEARGHRVLVAGNYGDAVVILRLRAPRYAVVDLQMPGASGLDLLRSIKELRPGTVVAMLSGNRSDALEAEAMRLGGAKYLTKPLDADQLIAALLGA